MIQQMTEQQSYTLYTNRSRALAAPYYNQSVIMANKILATAQKQMFRLANTANQKAAEILRSYNVSIIDGQNRGLTPSQYYRATQAKRKKANVELTVLSARFTGDVSELQITLNNELGAIVGGLSALFESDIGAIAAEIIDNTVAFANDFINNMGLMAEGFINDLQTQIKDMIVGVVDALTTMAVDMINTVITTIQSIIDMILAPFNSFYTMLEDIAGFLDKMMDFFNRLEGQVNMARQALVRVPDGFGGFKFQPKNILGTMDVESFKLFKLSMLKPEFNFSIKMRKNPIAKYVTFLPALIPQFKFKIVLPLVDDSLKAKYGKVQVRELKDGTTEIHCQERGLTRRIHGSSGTTQSIKKDGTVDWRITGDRRYVIAGEDDTVIDGNKDTKVKGDYALTVSSDMQEKVVGNKNAMVYGNNSIKSYGETTFDNAYDYICRIGMGAPPLTNPSFDPDELTAIATEYLSNMTPTTVDGNIGSYILSVAGNYDATISSGWMEDIYGMRGKKSTIWGTGGLMYTCLSGGMTFTTPMFITATAGTTVSVKAGASINCTAGVNISSKAVGEISSTAGGSQSHKAGIDMTLKAGINVTVQSGVNMDIKSGAVMNIDSGASLTIKSKGAMNISSGLNLIVDGGMMVTIKASALVKVMAPMIQLG